MMAAGTIGVAVRYGTRSNPDLLQSSDWRLLAPAPLSARPSTLPSPLQCVIAMLASAINEAAMQAAMRRRRYETVRKPQGSH